jgi:hypothetical protein
MQQLALERRRCATICVGTFGPPRYQGMEVPALMDGATDGRSFGPKTRWTITTRIQLQQTAPGFPVACPCLTSGELNRPG